MAMGNHQMSHLNTGKTVHGFMAMFVAARYAKSYGNPMDFFPLEMIYFHGRSKKNISSLVFFGWQRHV
jgi:hypothetical protein